MDVSGNDDDHLQDKTGVKFDPLMNYAQETINAYLLKKKQPIDKLLDKKSQRTDFMRDTEERAHDRNANDISYQTHLQQLDLEQTSPQHQPKTTEVSTPLCVCL